MALMTGRGGTGVQGETSEVYSDLSKLPPLGTKTQDAVGNEYVLVDFGASQPTVGFHYGEFVVYDHTFTATRLTDTSIGYVGVVMAGSAAGTITTTNRYGWVQIYGVHTAAWGSTSITTALTGHPLSVFATSDLGSVGSKGVSTALGGVIFGARAVSAPDSCASTALSTSALAAPFSVQLNYPFITGALNVHGTS